LKATGLLPDGSFRRVHQAGGNPDVVVVQNSVDAILPELTGVLSGRPVYSIYLLVGDRIEREWLLQYCLPGSAGGAEPQGMVVTLAAPAPVTAPYPRVTLRPPPGVLARDRRTVIAGSITTEGRFLALRGVAPAGPLAGGILEALRQWEFRPALRDGVPALVEILLLIPPER
jgi:hypothetical protein